MDGLFCTVRKERTAFETVEHNRLKKWEIALLLALCISLGWGLLFGETSCCAWWGVMYPELSRSAGESAETFAAAAEGEGLQLRFQLWEWLQSHLSHFFH